MSQFKIKIWDKHEKLVYNEGEGEYVAVPIPKDDDWHKFFYYLEVDQKRITGAQEYVIFDEEGTPQRCMMIFLSDDSYIIGRYKPESYEKMYEDYLKLIPKDLTEIVKDLKGE